MKEEWRKEVAAGITTPEKREVYRHQEAVTIVIKKEGSPRKGVAGTAVDMTKERVAVNTTREGWSTEKAYSNMHW